MENNGKKLVTVQDLKIFVEKSNFKPVLVDVLKDIKVLSYPLDINVNDLISIEETTFKTLE